MPRKPHCKIGESKSRKAARKDWAKAHRRKDVGTISNPVGSLPAPPTPNTSQYGECMPSWMEAYNCAKQLDDTRKFIAALKLHYEALKKQLPPGPQRDALLNDLAKMINGLVAKENQLTVALKYQTAAYLDCMNGMQT